jgi:xylulokinase
MIVGADIGTQSLKAAVLTHQFDVLGECAIAYQPRFPQPGWAEQDPQLWEDALRPAIAGALEAAGIASTEVTALGLTGQLDGCIAVGRDGLPLHPCLIWMDRRAEAEIAGIDAGFVLEKAGVVLDATHLAAKIRWLKAHVAEARQAIRFHVPVSYMVSRLTGEHVIDHATASTSMVYGLAEQAYDGELLDLFGLSEEELPKAAEAQSPAGGLTEEGAGLTGLPRGMIVAVGTGDDFGSTLGAGLLRPGHFINVLGTAEVVGALHSHPAIDRGRLVETHGFIGGQYFIENPGWLSGGALAWFRDTFRLADFAELDRLADAVPAGAEGVTFLPALSGAMAPEWIASARGVFHGLTPSHGTGHLARALLEGTAFAMRDVLDRVREMGVGVEALLIAGGGARSRVWKQMRADLTGLPVETAKHADSAPVGAALLAALAAGVIDDVSQAAGPLRGSGGAIEPDPDKRAAYDEAYQRYRRLFQALKPVFAAGG